MKIFLMLFLNFLLISNSFAAELITKANLISASASPILIIISLSCNLGKSYVDFKETALEDLQGVKIAWADINEVHNSQMFESSHPIEVGYFLLVKNGKILDTSRDADPEKRIITGNTARRWIYNTLKKHKIPFSMNAPEPDFLDPLPDSTEPDLSKGLTGYFPLTSDMQNASPGNATFYSRNNNNIRNNAYYMNGIYSEKCDEGSVYHTKNIGDSFSFFLNVKPENRKDDQKQLLFSAGYRNIDFYRDRKSGQLIAETFTSCKDCGNNKKEKNVDGHYIFPGTNVELNKWHSFAVSMDAKNGRISVLMNGKRLKDINLGKDYTETYKKDVWSRGLILALQDSGDGALLTGYARDMVSYNRAVTGTELMELHKKYAAVRTDTAVKTENPAPEKKDTSAQNNTLLKAAKTGNTKEVSSALKEGAEINTKYQGWTPLMFAAYFGHEETVKELIKNHADPLIEVSGWNAQRFARSKNYTGIVDLLENHSNSSRFFKERKFIVKNSRGEVLPPDLK